MRYQTASLIRFLLGGVIVTAFSFSISALASKASWNNYWNNTIYRVQTVDFNILSHTLPTKLSYLLLANNTVEIQNTLNSNYGLFGIVVTDCKTADLNCPEQKILYRSDSNDLLRDQLTVSSLHDQPYSFLRNPPPLIAESGYENALDQTWDVNQSANNSSNIIGRVYYVRSVPPIFEEDYKSWMGDILSNSGSHRYYLLLAISFISSGLFVWLIAYFMIEKIIREKNASKARMALENKSLTHEVQQFHQQLQFRIEQNQNLVKRETELYEKLTEYEQGLERYQKEQQRKEDELHQEISRLEVLRSTQKLELDSKLSELEALKEELAAIQKNVSTNINFEADINTKQQAIETLSLEIGKKDKELNDLATVLQEREIDLDAVKESNEGAIQEIALLNKSLLEVVAEKDAANNKVLELENQLLAVSNSHELEAALEAVKKDAEAFLHDAIENEEKARKLSEERDRLDQKLKDLAISSGEVASERDSLKAKNQKLNTEIKRLEDENKKYKDVTSKKTSPRGDKPLVKRPRDMDDLDFAKRATIQLSAFPKNLAEEAKRHYAKRDPAFAYSSIALPEIIDFLRHNYTNYDSLCTELRTYNQFARNIIECRVNAAIWEKL